MTIKQLKVLVNAIPESEDDIEVVRPGHDHSYYRITSSEVTDAEKIDRDYAEYFDDANMCSIGKKVKVFLVE